MQTSKVKDITPELASQFLKFNKINRPLREAAIEQYALDMRKGHWVLNHQGIAFDTKGNLVDGQHRLHAIIMAGLTIKMLVTTGMEERLSRNGVQVAVMDTVDRGRTRKLGDQLVLRHGCTNGRLTASVLQTIASIITEGNRQALSVPSAVAIWALYKSEVDFVISNMSREIGMRGASVLGGCAFAIKGVPEKCQEFYQLLTSGEGLYKTGATAPIYAVRKFIQTKTGGNGTERWRLVCSVLNAAKHFVDGYQLTQIKHTKLGVEYFMNHQKSAVAKVLEIVTL